jgi:hypothetical protein
MGAWVHFRARIKAQAQACLKLEHSVVQAFSETGHGQGYTAKLVGGHTLALENTVQNGIYDEISVLDGVG